MNLTIIHIANSIARFVMWLKRGQRIKPKTDTVKVNIGAGLSVADGWINVDSNLHTLFSKLPAIIIKTLYRLSGVKQRYSQKEYLDLFKNHTFVLHNLEYGMPFPDESVDYLYSSHLLEHLFKDDAANLLREAYRVLKEGGRIRICVPDLEHAISLYHQGNKQEALDFFFTTSKSTYYFSRHKYMYDFDLLRSLLDEAGFIDIERCTYKKGKVPDINKLDNRPDKTLFVEAVKCPHFEIAARKKAA